MAAGTMTGIRTGRRLQAERLAARLPPLLLAALRVADTVVPGLHGRRRSGPGDAFWQFRHYQAGDPVRSIDWRRSARSDPIFVRENEWESAQTLRLWCDGSASMHWRSRRELPEKFERAAVLLLALAALLLRSGEQVGLLGIPGLPVRGAARLGALAERLARASGRQPDGFVQDAPSISLPIASALPRHSQIVLFGDFLDPLPEIEARFRSFAAQGVRGHVVQVLDPAEEALPMRGRVRFEGLEAEGSLLIRRAERIRPAYIERMAAQRHGLSVMARRLGWTYAAHHTDAPPQKSLLALHTALTLAPDI